MRLLYINEYQDGFLYLIRGHPQKTSEGEEVLKIRTSSDMGGGGVLTSQDVWVSRVFFNWKELIRIKFFSEIKTRYFSFNKGQLLLIYQRTVNKDMWLLWTNLFYFTNTVILNNSNRINNAFLSYNHNYKVVSLKKHRNYSDIVRKLGRCNCK